MRYSIAIAAAASLILVGCGDDGSSLTATQADAAQSVIDSAAEDGLTLDEGCVNDIAAQLSDADAELAAAEDDPELSAEGQELTQQLFSCADQDELVELLVGELGSGFDQDCARDALGELDLVELLASTPADSEPPAEFLEAITPCAAG